MIIKELKFDRFYSEEVIKMIEEYEGKYILEDTKYYENQDGFFIRFKNNLDFNKVKPYLLINSIHFEFYKIKAAKEEIREEYINLVEEFLN